MSEASGRASPEDLVLLHYSAKPLRRVTRSRLDRPAGVYKPVGLWVSVEGDDDWRSWCEGEQWGLERLAVATRVFLKPGANVLLVEGTKALDAFDAEFRRPIAPHLDLCEIDWSRVASRWGGIIIAPYVWERRLARGFSWYYGWDCASGCIWDPKVIARLEPHVDPAPAEGEGYGSPRPTPDADEASGTNSPPRDQQVGGKGPGTG